MWTIGQLCESSCKIMLEDALDTSVIEPTNALSYQILQGYFSIFKRLYLIYNYKKLVRGFYIIYNKTQNLRFVCIRNSIKFLKLTVCLRFQKIYLKIIHAFISQPPTGLCPMDPDDFSPSNFQICVDFVYPGFFFDAYYSITRHCKELWIAPFPTISCYIAVKHLKFE